MLDNPLYASGALVGLALGVFYGFDGWRGSTEDVDLKDSPRAKNMIWLFTGAFTTLIGDVRAVDSSAKRPILLLFYCAAALAGAATVVLGWGAFVLIDSFRVDRRLGSDYGSLDALGDYLFFGYRKYRERKSSSQKRRAFIQDYLKQLTYSITAAGSEITGEQSAAVVVRGILRSMAAVVKKYRGDKDGAVIRANIMLLRRCDATLRQRLQFVTPGIDVENCLELVTYDDNDEHRDLVLPVPAARYAQAILPGAPRTLIGETPDVIDDTSHIDFPSDMSDKVKSEMARYFASKRESFRSFASLRVIGGGRPIAVVNIDCSEIDVFGSSGEDKRELIGYLFPFCSSLGILISNNMREDNQWRA